MKLIVIAHNIRSAYNVGAILRSCDGFGATAFYATGYTPYPTIEHDDRPPHLRAQITQRIAKTALGAESSVHIHHREDPARLITEYKNRGYTIAALEQTAGSAALASYIAPDNLVLMLGEEVHGIVPDLLQKCDVALEIPMRGRKESFNVSVAAGIALYALTTGSVGRSKACARSAAESL